MIIDNLQGIAGGEHAVAYLVQQLMLLHDLGSTNGTYVNWRQARQAADPAQWRSVRMGKYKIRSPGRTGVRLRQGPGHRLQAPLTGPASMPAPLTGSGGIVRVVTGPAAGREVALTKVVTTRASPGVAVASITKRHHNFVFGPCGYRAAVPASMARSLAPTPWRSRAAIYQLAGAEMEFVQG